MVIQKHGHCSLPLLLSRLCKLKLLLNAEKTKLIVFTKSKMNPQILTRTVNVQDKQIERLATKRYFGFSIDECLTFKPHIVRLVLGILDR
jgi:hypothetical protein